MPDRTIDREAPTSNVVKWREYVTAAENDTELYTADPVWMRKLDKLAEQNPEQFSISLGHMGLTTWKNAPDGKIVKSDVSLVVIDFFLKVMTYD